MENYKVAVTGATGRVASYFLHSLLSSNAGNLFGKKDAMVTLRLLDIPATENALEGLCEELEDYASPYIDKIHVYTDPRRALHGIDWAILIGAAPRSEGMQRKDLLKANGKIFTELGKTLNGAHSDAKVLVVGNPCNTNALIAAKNSELPDKSFFAMTMLDEMRAKVILAKKTDVGPDAIQKLNIWGNHSSTTLCPDIYNARINDRPLTDFVDHSWLKNDFVTQVRTRGDEIIRKRGTSSTHSAARAIWNTVFYLTHDSDRIYSVASISTGKHYKVEPDIVFSFPTRTQGGKIEIVDNFHINKFLREKIDESEAELIGEKEIAKELGYL